MGIPLILGLGRVLLVIWGYTSAGQNRFQQINNLGFLTGIWGVLLSIIVGTIFVFGFILTFVFDNGFVFLVHTIVKLEILGIMVLLFLCGISVNIQQLKNERVQGEYTFNTVLWYLGGVPVTIFRAIGFIGSLFFVCGGLIWFVIVCSGEHGKNIAWIPEGVLVIGFTFVIACIIFGSLFLTRFVDRCITSWFQKRIDTVQAFFQEVRTYDALSISKESSDIALVLQESEKIAQITEDLIKKRKYALLVFDTSSYRNYKAMIHEKIRFMIPFLETQRKLLSEKIEEKQVVLEEARQEIDTHLGNIPSLRYTADIQKIRLDEQIQKFGELQRIMV